MVIVMTGDCSHYFKILQETLLEKNIHTLWISNKSECTSMKLISSNQDNSGKPYKYIGSTEGLIFFDRLSDDTNMCADWCIAMSYL